ncbi:MAG: universal stress protein [Thermodesulfovibrionales bacterium]
MDYKIDQADLALLWKAGLSDKDIRHSVFVAEKALDIAKRTGADLDMELVGRGAIFHDLGKALTHSYQHGEVGAELGERLGLPSAIADIARKHFHGGLTYQEAQDLGLPDRDYTPHRIEERIVIYADRLVDIIADGYINLRDDREAEEDFENLLVKHPKYGKNNITRERYIGYHREIQNLIQNAVKQTGGITMNKAKMCPIVNERILVATDGSEYSQGAIREAIGFAKVCSSKLYVMTTIEVIADGETATQQAEDELEAEAQKHLDAVKAQALKDGVEAETFISYGEPHQNIVEEATKKRIDLIFIGRRGRAGLSKLLLGEVASKVIGHADCKVIVVPKSAAIGPKTILVATDGSGHSISAAREAVRIANKCGSSIIALSSMRSEGEAVAAKANIDQVLSMAREEGVPAEGITPLGRSKDVIVETAGGRGADLIVMGIPMKSAFQKIFSGSATEQVIGKAGCAVLIVKGEESPATN